MFSRAIKRHLWRENISRLFINGLNGTNKREKNRDGKMLKWNAKALRTEHEKKITYHIRATSKSWKIN